MSIPSPPPHGSIGSPPWGVAVKNGRMAVRRESTEVNEGWQLELGQERNRERKRGEDGGGMRKLM